MSQRHPILLMTEEPATINAVSTALSSNGQLQRENVCRDLSSLGTRLGETPASAALVDIDFHGPRVLASLEPLVRRFPETRFIAVSSVMEPNLMLEAMQAGTRHFMKKQELATALHDVLRRLCYGGAPSTGKVVSIFSASGGCGATAIAVNLAWEMQAIAERQALLVDLDYAYGAVNSYLGVEGSFGVLDLQERTGALDPELISTTSMPFGERIRVLASSSPARLGTGGGYERLTDMVGACARSSALVVVDAPRLPAQVAGELAQVSAANLLVMQLTVKDVRLARSFLKAMESQGIARDKITLLVNRYRRRGTLLELDEAQRALEGATLECISNDFASVTESLNLGKPLEQVAPRSVVRRELQQLARRLMHNGLNGGAP